MLQQPKHIYVRVAGALSRQVCKVTTASTNFINPGLTNIRYPEVHDESILLESVLPNSSHRIIHFHRDRQDEDDYHHCRYYDDASCLHTI